MKPKAYLIEEENSTLALEIAVNNRLEQGYVPIGGLTYDGLRGQYLQALYWPKNGSSQLTNTDEKKAGWSFR